MTLPWWVGYFQAIGGLATAGALGFVGFQTILSKRQTRLMQEQIGRAWIGGGTDSGTGQKISYDYDRLVLSCKNYGSLPARVSSIKSAISKSQLSESGIRSTSERQSKSIIFPNHQDSFNTDEKLGIYDKAFEDIVIWFGFIVGYEATSKNLGEYGIIGKYVRSRAGSLIDQTDEWFEPKSSKVNASWYKSKFSLSSDSSIPR